MATFVVLGNWTEQGVKGYAESTARARANEAAAAAMGGRIVATYWTLGQYDFVTIVDAPDDTSMAIGNLIAAQRGTARTETLRAFTMDEMDGIIARVKAAVG